MAAEKKPEPTTQWRYVGNHAQDGAGGAMFGPGDFVDLTQAQVDDPFNKRLIDEGLLIPTESTGA